MFKGTIVSPFKSLAKALSTINAYINGSVLLFFSFNVVQYFSLVTSGVWHLFTSVWVSRVSHASAVNNTHCLSYTHASLESGCHG